MDVIDMDSVADIVFQLKWNSQHAAHNECYAARGINLWRDWLPDNVRRSLIGKRSWEHAAVSFSAGELFGSDGGHLKIDRKQFSRNPKAGRFYPKGCLSDLPGVFPQNMQPIRCVGVNNGHMDVDIAHPLALQPLSLSMTARRQAPEHHVGSPQSSAPPTRAAAQAPRVPAPTTRQSLARKQLLRSNPGMVIDRSWASLFRPVLMASRCYCESSALMTGDHPRVPWAIVIFPLLERFLG